MDQMTYFVVPARSIESFARAMWPTRQDYIVETENHTEKNINTIYRVTYKPSSIDSTIDTGIFIRIF